MAQIPRLNEPPAEGGSYIIPQFEGELLSIPGSKGVFRILTSALQTDDTISVFTSGSALADAPGFHHHNEAHDIFLVTKGQLKLYNGDRCKILGPGDFGSIPPKVIHNPHTLGPITETFGVIHPASWLDFFRYVTEKYDGVQYPEFDDRNLREILIPRVIAAQGKYDVHFHPNHQAPELSEWGPEDEKLPDGPEPYYLRANTGPRWLLGGVLSRPFATTKQTEGKFAISSIESSSKLANNPFSKKIAFPKTHHCFSVVEGAAEFEVDGFAPTRITEGETIFVAKGTPFSLKFSTKVVRIWTFTSGDGIETVIHEAGKSSKGYALPDSPDTIDEAALNAVYQKLGVQV